MSVTNEKIIFFLHLSNCFIKTNKRALIHNGIKTIFKQIDRIIMCLFLKKDIAIYDEQMQLYFPLDREETGL